MYSSYPREHVNVVCATSFTPYTLLPAQTIYPQICTNERLQSKKFLTFVTCTLDLFQIINHNEHSVAISAELQSVIFFVSVLSAHANSQIEMKQIKCKQAKPHMFACIWQEAKESRLLFCVSRDSARHRLPSSSLLTVLCFHRV